MTGTRATPTARRPFLPCSIVISRYFLTGLAAMGAAPMADATTRFSGYASAYDRVRPQPPGLLAEVISQWAEVTAPDVIDIGTGSGLSLMPWTGRARSVTGVEPSGPMREIARQRAGSLADQDVFRLVEGAAEDTGVPRGSADT